MRKSLALLGGAAALACASTGAWAQDKVIKLGFAQDFTKVYTFVSSEYSQGQRDYLSLINSRGGVKGYTFEATVVDHGNEPQRGIEAYERFKADGAVLIQNALEDSARSSRELAAQAVSYAHRLQKAVDTPEDVLRSRTSADRWAASKPGVFLGADATVMTWYATAMTAGDG